jgi:hypothetical protein
MGVPNIIPFNLCFAHFALQNIRFIPFLFSGSKIPATFVMSLRQTNSHKSKKYSQQFKKN